MQAVLTASGKRFLVDAQWDPVEFLSWLLHELHRDLGGTRKHGSSVVDRALQGELLVTTRKDSKAADGTVTTTETKDKCARPPRTRRGFPSVRLFCGCRSRRVRHSARPGRWAQRPGAES